MRRDESLLQDLALACQDILDFIEGMDAAKFYSDIKTQAAVQQRFMILGEATKRLSMAFRETRSSDRLEERCRYERPSDPRLRRGGFKHRVADGHGARPRFTR